MRKIGNVVEQVRCLWLRAEKGRGGDGRAHDKTLLERDRECKRCVEIESSKMLTELSGPGTVRLAGRALLYCRARFGEDV